MLKILVYDRDHNYLAWFRKKFGNNKVVTVSEAPIFNSVLVTNQPWDSIFLGEPALGVVKAFQEHRPTAYKIVVYSEDYVIGKAVVDKLSAIGYSVEHIKSPYPNLLPVENQMAFKVTDNFKTIRGFKTRESATETAKRIFEGRIGLSYKAFLKSLGPEDTEFFGHTPTIESAMAHYGINVVEDRV
jgi:hypothetical protein